MVKPSRLQCSAGKTICRLAHKWPIAELTHCLCNHMIAVIQQQLCLQSDYNAAIALAYSSQQPIVRLQSASGHKFYKQRKKG